MNDLTVAYTAADLHCPGCGQKVAVWDRKHEHEGRPSSGGLLVPGASTRVNPGENPVLIRCSSCRTESVWPSAQFPAGGP